MTKVLAVRVPRNEVRVPGPQFWVLLVVRDLSSLEPETCVDTKGLVVEISGANAISENGLADNESTHSESFPTVCQSGGKLIEGMGHAGHRTASSPGDVPLIPV